MYQKVHQDGIDLDADVGSCIDDLCNPALDVSVSRVLAFVSSINTVSSIGACMEWI